MPGTQHARMSILLDELMSIFAVPRFGYAQNQNKPTMEDFGLKPVFLYEDMVKPDQIFIAANFNSDGIMIGHHDPFQVSSYCEIQEGSVLEHGCIIRLFSTLMFMDTRYIGSLLPKEFFIKITDYGVGLPGEQGSTETDSGIFVVTHEAYPSFEDHASSSRLKFGHCGITRR